MFLDPRQSGSIEGRQVLLEDPLDRSEIEPRQTQRLEGRRRANRVLLSRRSQSAVRLMDGLVKVRPGRQRTEVIHGERPSVRRRDGLLLGPQVPVVVLDSLHELLELPTQGYCLRAED
jgi:hypothetical protein